MVQYAINEPAQVTYTDKVFYRIRVLGKHPSASKDGGYPADDVCYHIMCVIFVINPIELLLKHYYFFSAKPYF